MPAANSFLTQRADGQWQLNWDTLFATNGVYVLKARFQYSAGGITNLAADAPVTVLVSNKLLLDPLTRSFTDFVLVNLKLTTNHSDFRVDLYDDFGSALAYAQGTTTNGKIQLRLDLLDGQGNRVYTGNIKAKVLLAAPGTLSSSTNRPIFFWYVLEFGSPATSFAVAWGWHRYSSSFNDNREQMMLGGVINILSDPSNFDAYALTPAAFNVPYARTFRFDNENDKTVLFDALKASRNFFWCGHGSLTGISGDTNNTSISTSKLELLLENQAFRSSTKKPKTDKHPYRLAILNGCETHSPLWAGAFGIPFSPEGSTNPVSEYLFAGREPRAFVGWEKEGELPDAGLGAALSHAEYGEALSCFFSYWMSGFPLEICLDQFAAVATGYGFAGQDSWKISGCTDLTRGD